MKSQLHKIYCVSLLFAIIGSQPVCRVIVTSLGELGQPN